jgi:hypothetical protein
VIFKKIFRGLHPGPPLKRKGEGKGKTKEGQRREGRGRGGAGSSSMNFAPPRRKCKVGAYVSTFRL